MSDEASNEEYQSPSTDSVATTDFDNLLQPLLQTKPWVLLCSIMGFISSGFMFLAGIVFIIGISAFLPANNGEMGVGIGIFMGSVYIFFGIISLFPALWLYKYSSYIRAASMSRSFEDITTALKYQKSFWKFVGIIMVIYLLFFLLAIVIAGFGALFSDV